MVKPLKKTCITVRVARWPDQTPCEARDSDVHIYLPVYIQMREKKA